MENYNQKIVALVLNVKKPVNIICLQKELIEFLKKFESDDRVYIYNNSGMSFSKGSKAIAELARYDFDGMLPLYDLMRDAISALEFESSLDKILIVFNDAEADQFQVNKMLRRVKTMVDAKTYFFEIGTPSEIESRRKNADTYNLEKAAEMEGFQMVEDLTGLAQKLNEIYKDGGI